MTSPLSFSEESSEPITFVDREDFTDCLPLLVTGIAGVAGYNALHYFQSRYPGRVIGTRPPQTWKLVGRDIVAVDTVRDRESLGKLFEKHRFRAVLNCLGNCALKKCELDTAMAHELNVQSVESVVAQVKKHNCRLVHLSSDLVFSGSDPHRRPYLETDPTDPVTVYGKTMVQGESIVQREVPSAVILRISLPMGPSFNRHAGAIDWIESRFRKDRPATLYFDEVRSATYCDDLNRVFERMLIGTESGLFHCGGPRPVTLYQIAQIVNRTGGFDPDLLIGCPRVEAGPIPPRAGNVTMDSGRLYSVLGCAPFRAWPFHLEDVSTHRGWHADRDVGEVGSFARIEELLYRYV